MDALSLADWRRRVGELYAEVRAAAATDPEAACHRWRAAREALYREHPQSPLPVEQRRDFRAAHFAYDHRMRFVLPLLAMPDGAARDGDGGGADQEALPVAIPTSGQEPAAFVRNGWLAVPFPEGTRHLALFWLPDYAGGLFLSFRDATGGAETYGGGRYLLDSAKGADSGRRPGAGHGGAGLQLRLSPILRFRPELGVPADAAGESPGPADSRGGAAALARNLRLLQEPMGLRLHDPCAGTPMAGYDDCGRGHCGAMTVRVSSQGVGHGGARGLEVGGSPGKHLGREDRGGPR